jgi:hypothetical protein
MDWLSVVTDIIGNLGLPVGLVVVAIAAIRGLWFFLRPKLDSLFERGNKAIDSHVALVDKLRISVGEINHNQEVIARCAENTTQALRQVGELVQRHDAGQSGHHDACKEAGIAVQRLHAGAMMACDKAEKIASQYEIDISAEMREIREALKA